MSSTAILSKGQIKEPIDEHGGPAAHVDDSPALGRGDGPDELERQPWLVLIPANAGLALGLIDRFPMLLSAVPIEHEADGGASLEESATPGRLLMR